MSDRISDEDLETHTRMIARYREAERLQARANQLAAGFMVWGEDLLEKYGLDAAKGDGIQEDGTIIRRD